ncbi:MAG: hypothetical protein MZV65_01105 [Chromatiales bacterium]|nr:hypothetical protein [Chromatiales bacterium]
MTAADLQAFDAFVRGGGTLVCASTAPPRWAIQQFKLPVKNAVEGLKPDDFFLRGSIVEVRARPRASGDGGDAGARRGVRGRQPRVRHARGIQGERASPGTADSGSPLLSGYLIGEKHLSGKAAAVEADVDQGRVDSPRVPPAVARPVVRDLPRALQRGAERPAGADGLPAEEPHAVSHVRGCLSPPPSSRWRPATRARSPRRQAGRHHLQASVLAGGLVTGVAWDGGTLIIQTAAVENGEPKAHYFAVAAPGMEVRPLDVVPASVEAYWKKKAARKSPTGLGAITIVSGSKLPMHGHLVAGRGSRMPSTWAATRSSTRCGSADSCCTGGAAPSPMTAKSGPGRRPNSNRVAYVDDKGDIWVAGADGRSPELLLKGSFTLPAWSDDGRAVAIAEKKGDGGAWEISVVYLPERFRRPL